MNVADLDEYRANRSEQVAELDKPDEIPDNVSHLLETLSLTLSGASSYVYAEYTRSHEEI